MTFLLDLLAAAGIVAVLLRMGRAGLRAMVRGVDSYMKGEAIQLRARRGDLTGMADAERSHAVARKRKRTGLVQLGFWSALLVLPLFTPWTAPIYAAYSLLWVVSWLRGRIRSAKRVYKSRINLEENV
jgi:hypothetical protein